MIRSISWFERGINALPWLADWKFSASLAKYCDNFSSFILVILLNFCFVSRIALHISPWLRFDELGNIIGFSMNVWVCNAWNCVIGFGIVIAQHFSIIYAFGIQQFECESLNKLDIINIYSRFPFEHPAIAICRISVKQNFPIWM